MGSQKMQYLTKATDKFGLFTQKPIKLELSYSKLPK